MGQLESAILGKDENSSNKNVNAELQSEDGLVDTDHETRFKTIMKNFALAEHNHKDLLLGNVDVYRCFHNKNFRIYLKETFTKSEEELHAQMDMWVKRQQQLQHPNLIQLHACCSFKVESFCATFHKIFMIFDSVETDLLSLIRRDKIQSYSEDELWFILDSLVGALEYMQERDLPHQSLKLDTIYITTNHKNINLFKLSDSQLMGYEPNYDSQLRSFDKYIYLSPLLFQQYGNQIQNPVHNEYKSDVFTLGMLLIHLSLFESCADVYTIMDHSINQAALNNKLQRINERYSNEYFQVIREMVILDEKYRPDFRELDRKLSSCPKIFGRRICEMVQVPNLYKMKPASFMSDFEIEKKKQDEIRKKQIIEEKEQKQKELTDKDIIIKAIQQQDALNIIKESIAKTSYLTEQLFRQSQRADVQFQVDNILLNPSKILQGNDNQIPQQNFIDQQHQILFQNQLPNTNNQGNYQEKQLQFQSPIQNNNKALNNYEIPYTHHSPQKNRQLAGAGGIMGQNAGNQQFQNNMNKLGAQEHISQFQSPISNNNNFNNQNNMNDQDNQIINLSGYHQSSNNKVERELHQSPGNQNEIMLTSTSKQLFNENPDLPKIISKNLVRQTIKYKNGNIYEGDILDGKKHGYGVFIFNNQQKYEGEWKDNKRHGKGTQFFQNGQIKYEGQWQEDQYHGFGTLFNKEPKPLKISEQQMQQYAQLIQSQPQMTQEQVLMVRKTFISQIKERYYQDLNNLQDYWVKYEGDFKNGQKEGFGNLTYSNNDYFVGQFSNNQVHGNGNYMYEDAADFVAGEWKNNKLLKKY